MLPSKLKHLNLFGDGDSYHGRVEEIQLPKLERVMEEHRAAGMNAPIKLDQGMEALSTEWTASGLMEDPLHSFGTGKYNGVILLMAGSYDAEDGSGTKAVEIEMHGRHSVIDMGTAKPGEGGQTKITTELAYYKLTIDGKEMIEIDTVNMVEKVNGVDRLKEHRQNLNLNS